MILLLDIDGVMLDFVGGLGDQYRSVTEYDFIETLDKEEQAKIRRRMSRPSWWSELKPIEGAPTWEQLQATGDEVYFVTKPYRACPGWMDARVAAMSLNFGVPSDRIVVTGHKHLVRGHVLVDDCPDYAAKFPGQFVIYDAPYNKEHVGPRVRWEDGRLVSC